MSSFIAPAPASTATAPLLTVQNDGFFPDIDLVDVRASMRLDGTVTDIRLRDAIIKAVIQTNRELARLKLSKIAAGVPVLEQDEPQIGGRSISSTQYRMAVYHTAKASVTEKHADFDATKSGVEAAEKVANTADNDLREARWAVRDLLGEPRSTIELI